MIVYLFRKLFLAKEIKSKAGVLHFQRWRIVYTPWFAVYIHRIFKSDSDLFMHDHPWDYFSMVLFGSYNEITPDTMRPGQGKNVILLPGFCSRRKAEAFHKIGSLNTKSVTTLFVTGRRRRDWGFMVGDRWIQHEQFRKNKTQYEQAHRNKYGINLSDSEELL